MEIYLKKIQATKTSNTYKTYCNALKAWFPNGNIDLSIPYIISRLEMWTVETNTKLLRCRILKSFLEFYSRNNTIDNYGDILDILSSVSGEYKLPDFVSAEQFNIIMQQPMSLRLKIAISLMYKNGLRSDEAIKIMTENYSPESKSIIIKKPKNHRDRIIFLNDTLNELVIQYTKESQSKFLLHTSTGKMLDARNLRREIKNICTKAGFPYLHCHAFRHGAAKYLLDHDIDIAKIQSFLGHASITTTQRYLHIDEKQQQEMKAVFDDIA